MAQRFQLPKTLWVLSALLVFSSGRGLAQTAPVAPRDANAVTLATKALQALAGGTAVSDITLQASASYTAGSDLENGSATMVALGNQQSLVTLNLTQGRRQEIRNGIGGVTVGVDGTAHTVLAHNNFVDAGWFYPGLTLAALATDRTLAVSYVGLETLGGQPAYHLRFYRALAPNNPTTAALIQHLSTMDLFLSTTTYLPMVFRFNRHSDKNTFADIPIEIRYGAYQPFNGVEAPGHIQKYVQNVLNLDLTVANAAVNSGVPASTFTLPAVPAGGAQ